MEININTNYIEKFILVLIIIEGVIGGGGRIFSIKGITLRMFLFFLIIIIYIFKMIIRKTRLTIDMDSVIIYCLITWFGFSSYLGVFNGHSTQLVFEDIKPLSYFLIFFPLRDYIVKYRFPIETIIKTLKISSYIVALCTIGITIAAKINFITTYNYVNSLSNEDFIFRTNGEVFFKGHIYVLIAYLFDFISVVKGKRVFTNLCWLMICSASIIMSGTRGLILAMIIGSLILGVIYFKDLIKKAAFIIPIIILVIWVTLPNIQMYFDYQRLNINLLQTDSGTMFRFNLISDGMKLFANSPILGSGFGTELPNRPTHLEISFLEILLKQGIIGSLIWVALFCRIFYLYIRIFKKRVSHNNSTINALVVSIICLLFVTNTNPFINNPIGILFTVLTLLIYLQMIGKKSVDITQVNKVLINKPEYGVNQY